MAVLLCSCESRAPDPFFNAAEWRAIETLSPLPELPSDPTNPVEDLDAAAELGQRLFFDKRFSGPLAVSEDPANGGLGAVGEVGRVSCATCHQPSKWFIDHRVDPKPPLASSLGVKWTGRNAPSLVNVAYYRVYAWDGSGATLWRQIFTAATAEPTMGATPLGVARVMRDHYQTEYEAVFPPLQDPGPGPDPESEKCQKFVDGTNPDPTPVACEIFFNFARAIAAYLRRLVSRRAPFDRYVAGEHDAISPAAKRGLRLFVGEAFCIDCHSGPTFSDQGFHNLGVPQVGATISATDLGRGAGRFRTKSLRQVAETGPYFHTGGMTTLHDVVQFYNWGGGSDGYLGEKDPFIVPLGLTDGQVDDLVEFLKTLTGDPIAPELREDTSR